jgi:hypothetical protein
MHACGSSSVAILRWIEVIDTFLLLLLLFLWGDGVHLQLVAET